MLGERKLSFTPVQGKEGEARQETKGEKLPQERQGHVGKGFERKNTVLKQKRSHQGGKVFEKKVLLGSFWEKKSPAARGNLHCGREHEK